MKAKHALKIGETYAHKDKCVFKVDNLASI